MSESLIATVQSLLRSSEEVKIAIQARAIPDQDAEQFDEPSTEEADRRNTFERDQKRIVAVVTHVDSSTGDEQGWYVYLQIRSAEHFPLPAPDILS